LLAMYTAEIERQDLPTGLRRGDTFEPLALLDREAGAALLGADRFGYPSESGLRYLCGRDVHRLPWICNVDPRLRTVATAWSWVVPPAVWQAVRERRRVLVFGEVMIVQFSRGAEDYSRLPVGYAWEPARRVVVCNGRACKVPFPARAFATKVGPWESTRAPAPRWLERR